MQFDNQSLIKPVKVIFFYFLYTISSSSQAQSTQEWYDHAQERIDTLRKGQFGLKIYDKSGQPYAGNVKVTMMRHEFPFGIAFDFYEGEVQTEVPTETQWMKAAMYKYFNYGVSGNSFKWSGIDPNGSGPDYTNFEHAVAWTQKVGWDLRAHTLLWGGSEGDNHAMPQWVTNLGSSESVFAECEKRVRREVNRYRGIIKEYDVINEPLHATYTQDLYGDSLNWKAFQWAREEDPDAELFINEYNVEFAWGDVDQYKALIEDVIANGAPVTGIGMQAHFWDCCRPSINEVVSSINTLAEIGLPIKLTEFDFGGNLTEAEQAADLIKIYTIAFSHPSVNGLIYWNLADHLSWRENAGLLREDRSPKLAADTLLYLTQKLWATNFEISVTDGEVPQYYAYYGDYRVEVQFDDGVKEFVISCSQENSGTVFQLFEEEMNLKAVDLVEARLTALDQLELTFDKQLNPATIDKYDFRVFTSKGIGISEAQLADGDANKLIFSLDQNISVLDYATVSYFPGTLSAVDGAPTRAFGTEKIIISGDLNKAPVAEDKQFDLAENAAGGSEIGSIGATDPEGVELEYTITAGNHLGIFSIGKQTGVITLRDPFYLNHDEVPVHNLTVEVSDGVHSVFIAVTINLNRVLRLDKASVDLVVFPNPTAEKLTITSPSPFSAVSIYSLSGELVVKKQFASRLRRVTLDINLESGIYLLRVYDGAEIGSMKLIVDDSR